MPPQKNGNNIPTPNRFWRQVGAYGAAVLGLVGLAAVVEVSKNDPPVNCYYTKLAPVTLDGPVSPETFALTIPGVDGKTAEKVGELIIIKTHDNEGKLAPKQILAPTEIVCR